MPHVKITISVERQDGDKLEQVTAFDATDAGEQSEVGAGLSMAMTKFKQLLALVPPTN
jgi:hypothetical protein